MFHSIKMFFTDGCGWILLLVVLVALLTVFAWFSATTP